MHEENLISTDRSSLTDMHRSYFRIFCSSVLFKEWGEGRLKVVHFGFAPSPLSVMFRHDLGGVTSFSVIYGCFRMNHSTGSIDLPFPSRGTHLERAGETKEREKWH